MKQWTKEIEIDAPIEHVWRYLNGSLENMQKIMPKSFRMSQSPLQKTRLEVSIYKSIKKESESWSMRSKHSTI